MKSKRSSQKACANRFYSAAKSVAGEFAMKYYGMKPNDVSFDWVDDDFVTVRINDDYWDIGDMACALRHGVTRKEASVFAKYNPNLRPSFREFLYSYAHGDYRE